MSNARLITMAILLGAAPLATQAQQPTPPPATRLPSITLPAELDRVLRDYEKLWAAKDAAGLAAIFTDDGFVPSRTGWVRGRSAIEEQYKQSGGELHLRAHAYAVQDTVGYIVGAFGYGADYATRDNGKFVLALRRKAGGKWLIAADLDGANR